MILFIVEDIITAVAVDKIRKNLLYLGCKDTNLYWINLGQGLSSEPIAEQYSKFDYYLIAKVTQLKTSLVNRDVLICVADNNIFIWNSCSKQRLTDFFEHKTTVIYVSDMAACPQLIESIDSSSV